MYDIIFLEGDIMKKKLIIPIAIVLLLAITFTVFSVINSKVSVAFTPSKISGVNYNNYTNENSIDYKDNKFAYIESNLFGSKLLIKDDAGKITSLKGVTAPFQLTEDGVAFIKNQDLYLQKLDEQKPTLIEKQVAKFYVYNNDIIYSTIFQWNTNKKQPSKLLVYNVGTKKIKTLHKDISDFCLGNDKVYVDYTDYENDIENFIEISLKDFKVKKIAQIEIQSYPFGFQANNKKIVLHHITNTFTFIDPETKEIKNVRAHKSEHANDLIIFVLDNENLYFSYQATNTNGSLVSDENDETNGTYKIDLKTYEKQKITDEVFDELYLFENNQLFGIKDKQIININIKP